MARAIFLDRDGVINYDAGFVHRRVDFFFLPGVVQALRSFPRSYTKVIISNQSGIGRGYYSRGAAEALNHWMLESLTAEGVRIDAIFLCPHAPEDNCTCRKPEPGLFYEAKRKLGIDFAGSWVIGDKESDVLVGKRTGCLTMLVNKNRVERANHQGVRADFRVAGLKEAAAIILSHSPAG
jgi:D-glycero-D-manno-heptose 1,7-bisphosphate phosphatase